MSVLSDLHNRVIDLERDLAIAQEERDEVQRLNEKLLADNRILAAEIARRNETGRQLAQTLIGGVR